MSISTVTSDMDVLLLFLLWRQSDSFFFVLHFFYDYALKMLVHSRVITISVIFFSLILFYSSCCFCIFKWFFNNFLLKFWSESSPFTLDSGPGVISIFTALVIIVSHVVVGFFYFAFNSCCCKSTQHPWNCNGKKLKLYENTILDTLL